MYKIRAYKMTHATGFAPNPFDGYLTLACCKPMIRKKGIVNVGDWIVGIGSKTMEANAKGDKRTYDNKIIYAMKVCCLIPWTEYYQKCKELKLLTKIHESGEEIFDIYGDCIYKWKETTENLSFTSKYEQDEFIKYVTNFDFTPNIFHGTKQATHDLGGEYVIVGCPKHSYFLGRECFDWAPISNKNIKRSAYGTIIRDENPDDLEKVILTKTKVKPISEESPILIKGRIIESNDTPCNNYQGPITDKEVLEELNKDKIKREADNPVITLSRKGFDTAYGRCPSLIVNEKQMISFPIPEDSDQAKKDMEGKYYPEYSNLTARLDNGTENTLEDLILASECKDRKVIFNDMTLGKRSADGNKKDEIVPRCHLDPQLYNYRNDTDFYASLGQMGIPARLLEKYGIKEGDLFLFFGNFKFVEIDDKNKKSLRTVHPVIDDIEYNQDFYHCIWGYMEIGKKILNPQNRPEDVPEYIREHHPHMEYTSCENYIYLAAEKLSDMWCPEEYNGQIRGYGVFDFDKRLMLSPANYDECEKPKEYLKPKRNAWTILPLYVNNSLKTQIPVRGQEFVLFPNSVPDGESKYIDNYNDFIKKIKDVIKEQADKGKFLKS